MCDCAETMQPGDRFYTREGIKTVHVVTPTQVVATVDFNEGPLQETKYNLADIHRVNCPKGGYPF